MSRVAQLDIEFRAVLDKARTDYRSFKSEVENSPLRVPFSGEGTGVPSSTRTLGGAIVSGSGGPGANPLAAVTSLGSSLVVLKGQVDQLASSLARLGSGGGGAGGGPPAVPRSARDEDFTSRAERGIYNRFARAGGLFAALAGGRAVIQQFERRQELDDALAYGSPEQAAQVAAQQTREDRRGLVGSLIRTGFVRTVRAFGFNGPQTDEERFQEDRENLARIQSGRETERLTTEGRRSTRGTQLLSLDDIERRRAAAQFRFEDTEREAAEAKRGATATGVAPDAAGAVIRAANENVRKAKAYLDAESKQLDDERKHVLRRLGLESEIASDRAGNRPLQAARQEQQLRAENELFQFRNSPDLPQRQQVLAEQASALRAQQRRDTDADLAGLSGGNEALSYALARRPLQARLSEFRANLNEGLTRLGNDPETQEQRRRLFIHEGLQEQIAAQEDEDERQQIRLRQSTRRRQIGLLLSHNVVGAEAEGVVGGAEGRATALFNAGFRAESQDELRNAIGDLALTRQSFREGFHATAIGQNDFNIESPRQTQNIAEAFGSLADAEKRLQSDLAKGGGTGDEASNPVTKKLDDIALRIENAVRSLIPH